MSFFEIDGITVPILSVVDFTQSYDDFGSSVIQRMMDGTGKKQTNWTKIKTTLSGRGWVPAGLDGVDFSNPAGVLLKCAAAKMISSASNVAVLPADRRSDAGYEVRGYALVAGVRIDTTVGISTNTATLGAVAGATAYQFEYFPQIMVFAKLSSSGVDVTEANYSWRIEAEEV